MKSSSVILSLCWVLMILHWTTDMFPGGLVPFAFCGSYLIMWMFGFFKNEDQFGLAAIKKGGEIDDGLSDRQKDFIDKMQQGKEQELIDEISRDLDKIDADLTDAAVIKMVDEEGKHSTIIIRPNGEIIVDGDPDPEIVEAAQMLQETIIALGPQAVAEEIARQVAEMNERGEK